MMEMCLAPGLEHDLEFVVAAFGVQCWKCNLCGLWFDELDDSQP